MRRSSSLRRWVLKVALCLLAGAVVTWAVAWGCALWRNPGWVAPSEQSKPFAAVPKGTPSDWDPPREFWITRRFGSTEREWRGLWGDYSIIESDFGWPIHSMRYTLIEGFPGIFVRETIIPPPRGLECKALGFPAEVLFIGFTINTLVAAGLMLAGFEGVAAWRCRAWRRRGRCAWCGYHRVGVAGDAACPECGRTL